MYLNNLIIQNFFDFCLIDFDVRLLEVVGVNEVSGDDVFFFIFNGVCCVVVEEEEVELEEEEEVVLLRYF